MDASKFLYLVISSTLFWSCGTQANFAGVRIRLIGNVGEITSPNYPSKYPLNSSVVWTISTDDGKRIKLQFIDFKVERAKRCIYDSVQIREDLSKPWSDVDKLCGMELPQDYVTKGTLVQIRFKSDALNVVEKGFKLKWTAIDVTASTKCTRTTATVTKTASKTCIGHPVKTQIKILPCPTPAPRYVDGKGKGCNCVQKTGSSDKNKERIATTDPSNSLSYSNLPGGASTDTSKDFNLTVNKPAGKIEYVGTEDTVMIATFSALLTLFIIICVGLVIALWRRRKEIDELRQFSRSKSPEFDWVPYIKESVKPANGCNGHGYEQVPSARKKSCDEVRTIDSLNRHLLRIKSEQLAQPFAQQSRRNNQENYTALLPQIVRTGNQHSVSSCDDAEEETSDIYVSSDVSGTGTSVGRCGRTGRVAV